MEIFINEDKKLLLEELSIYDLLKLLNVDSNGIVIEHNQKIVKKDSWNSTIIKNEDKIEIIIFMGGG